MLANEGRLRIRSSASENKSGWKNFVLRIEQNLNRDDRVAIAGALATLQLQHSESKDRSFSNGSRAAYLLQINLVPAEATSFTNTQNMGIAYRHHLSLKPF